MLPSMVTPGGSGRRLSADDWIQAGFALLAEDGPNALRIERLCERLEVTKGSFYWHFTDMRAYRAALVDAWSNLRDGDRRRFEDMGEVDPRERLRLMISALVNPSRWRTTRCKPACGPVTGEFSVPSDRPSSTMGSSPPTPICGRRRCSRRASVCCTPRVRPQRRPRRCGTDSWNSCSGPSLFALGHFSQLALSRCCSRSWAASSMSLCRHSEAL